MQVFIKRFWGFDPDKWPIVSFGLVGSLTALLDASSPGDVMAFVGTKKPPTPDDFQGRLLGLAEFGRERVYSREVLPPESFANAPKGPGGDIKWPYAVQITRAWKLTDQPLPELRDVLGRQLPMSAISNAVLLNSADAAIVLGLPREEVREVRLTPEGLAERAAIASLVGPGGSMGPPPASYTASVTQNAMKSASTYAFRFGTKNVWKVGWAYDPSARLKELNAHVPHEALEGQSWHGKGGCIQKWPSADQAFKMERRVLDAFSGEVKFGERVHCTKDQLEAAWFRAFKAGP